MIESNFQIKLFGDNNVHTYFKKITGTFFGGINIKQET